MSYEKIDLLFPYVIFAYGVLVSWALHHPRLVQLAQERLPLETWQRMSSHRGLALFCLWFGGLWVLQNLWTA